MVINEFLRKLKTILDSDMDTNQKLQFIRNDYSEIVLDESYFPITYLHRDDLEANKFDISNVTDDLMEVLSNEMEKRYIRSQFDEDLQNCAIKLKIPLILNLDSWFEELDDDDKESIVKVYMTEYVSKGFSESDWRKQMRIKWDDMSVQDQYFYYTRLTA